MEFDLASTKRLLARTPVVLESMLQNLEEPWTHAGYGDSE
jgi:hypothetical protein